MKSEDKATVIDCWADLLACSLVLEVEVGRCQRLLYPRKLKTLTCLFKCQRFTSVSPLPTALPPSGKKTKKKKETLRDLCQSDLPLVSVFSSSTHFGPSGTSVPLLRLPLPASATNKNCLICSQLKTQKVNVGKQDVCFLLGYLVLLSCFFLSLSLQPRTLSLLCWIGHRYLKLFLWSLSSPPSVIFLSLCLPLVLFATSPLQLIIHVAFKLTTSHSVCFLGVFFGYFVFIL